MTANIKNVNEFGYPKLRECDFCKNLSSKCKLEVPAYFKEGNEFRLMLIGQDPTIRNKDKKVENVLMLNDSSSQLYRWLSGLMGKDNFDAITIYATNAVKCTLESVPQKSKGGEKTLKDHFEFCKNYLTTEIENYKPNLVMTLGEPCHKLVTGMIEIRDTDDKYKQMKFAFDGSFKNANYNDVKFLYTPCLHIQTFRVAETYGSKVKNFKELIRNKLGQETNK